MTRPGKDSNSSFRLRFANRSPATTSDFEASPGMGNSLHRRRCRRIPMAPSRRLLDGGFTLVELLIVVAIIGILAAIAIPNFLEAQTRAKVARVKADLRTLSIGLETFYIDHNEYPEGTDNPARYDPKIEVFLGVLAPGYYTLRTRGDGEAAGRDFPTLTTPVAYVSEFYTDPFVEHASGFLTYCYRNAKNVRNGYVLTSFGPDRDLFESAGGKLGAGTLSTNPLSTAMDPNSPARLGDINERGVIHFMEKTDAYIVNAVYAMGGVRVALESLAYDPSNGTVSDGDIYRVAP